TDEYGFCAELHHEGCVSRGGYSASREIRNRQLSVARDDSYQFVWSLMFLGFGVEFFFAEYGENFHLLYDLANVLHGVDDVARAGFALSTDHGRAFGNPT